MIFASDLDQTLIYSTKSLRLLPGQTIPNLRCVEIYEGREISFMTDHVVEKLQNITFQHVFIPTTTRTIAQYQRISLFQERIIPAYSVVSNGGNILVHGEVDSGWRKQIGLNLTQLCLCPADLLASFQEIHDESWAGTVRMADELFYYCVVDRERVPCRELEEFSLWAEEQNWKISLQGRKLYLVPQVVNKWTAVNYLRELLEEEVVIAAGDSLLDLCMLEQADYAIAPCHGELWDHYSVGGFLAPKLDFTQHAGIAAADDILDYVKGCSLKTLQEQMLKSSSFHERNY